MRSGLDFPAGTGRISVLQNPCRPEQAGLKETKTGTGRKPGDLKPETGRIPDYLMCQSKCLYWHFAFRNL